MPHIPEDIVGHDKQKGELLKDIASNNITHAYLFAGTPHLGKMSTAQWFAWRILADGLPANEVNDVRVRMEKFIHPDFLCLDDLWIDEVNDDWNVIGLSSNVPQQHRSKDSPAKSDTIGIDDLRLLADRLHATGEGKRIVCIIRGVERMQVPAATSFLKILEEPPARVTFILTTDSIGSLLPTIVSRTRTLRFSKLKREEMQPLLNGRDDDDAAFALHIAQGAPGLFLNLLSDPDVLRAEKQLHAQAKHFWQAPSLKDRLSWILKATEKKENIDDVLGHLALALRELPDSTRRAALTPAFTRLLQNLKTNAHKALLLERFALAIHDIR